jgi:hypothetical protein
MLKAGHLPVASDERDRSVAGLLNLTLRVQSTCRFLVDRPHDPVAQRELLATLCLGYPLFGNPAEGHSALTRGLLSQASVQAETVRCRLVKGVAGQRTTNALTFALSELSNTVRMLTHTLRGNA